MESKIKLENFCKPKNLTEVLFMHRQRLLWKNFYQSTVFAVEFYLDHWNTASYMTVLIFLSDRTWMYAKEDRRWNGSLKI